MLRQIMTNTAERNLKGSYETPQHCGAIHIVKKKKPLKNAHTKKLDCISGCGQDKPRHQYCNKAAYLATVVIVL